MSENDITLPTLNKPTTQEDTHSETLPSNQELSQKKNLLLPLLIIGVIIAVGLIVIVRKQIQHNLTTTPEMQEYQEMMKNVKSRDEFVFTASHNIKTWPITPYIQTSSAIAEYFDKALFDTLGYRHMLSQIDSPFEPLQSYIWYDGLEDKLVYLDQSIHTPETFPSHFSNSQLNLKELSLSPDGRKVVGVLRLTAKIEEFEARKDEIGEDYARTGIIVFNFDTQQVTFIEGDKDQPGFYPQWINNTQVLFQEMKTLDITEQVIVNIENNTFETIIIDGQFPHVMDNSLFYAVVQHPDDLYSRKRFFRYNIDTKTIDTFEYPLGFRSIQPISKNLVFIKTSSLSVKNLETNAETVVSPEEDINISFTTSPFLNFAKDGFGIAISSTRYTTETDVVKTLDFSGNELASYLILPEVPSTMTETLSKKMRNTPAVVNKRVETTSGSQFISQNNDLIYTAGFGDPETGYLSYNGILVQSIDGEEKLLLYPAGRDLFSLSR